MCVREREREQRNIIFNKQNKGVERTFSWREILLQPLKVGNVVSEEDVVAAWVPGTVLEADHTEVTRGAPELVAGPGARRGETRG